MKRHVTVIVLVAMVAVAVLAACAPSATPTPVVIEKVSTVVVEKEKTVVVEKPATGGVEYAIIAPLIHSFFVPGQEGAAQAAQDLKINYVWLAPPEFSYEKQLELFESALSYPGIKGITLVSAQATGSMADAIKKAEAQGVSVALWAGCDEGDGSKQAAPICWAGSFYNMGVECAKRLATEMGDAGEVVIVQEMIGDANQDARRDGFKAEISKNHPNIKIVDTLTDCDSAGTTRCAETALAAHPKLKGYFATGQTAAIGAGSVFPKAGRTDIKVSAADDPAEVIAGIKSGAITFSYSQIPYASGYMSIYVPYKMAQGFKPTQHWIDLGIVFIDKNNVDTYANDVKAKTAELLKTVDASMKK